MFSFIGKSWSRFTQKLQDSRCGLFITPLKGPFPRPMSLLGSSFLFWTKLVNGGCSFLCSAPMRWLCMGGCLPCDVKTETPNKPHPDCLPWTPSFITGNHRISQRGGGRTAHAAIFWLHVMFRMGNGSLLSRRVTSVWPNHKKGSIYFILNAKSCIFRNLDTHEVRFVFHLWHFCLIFIKIFSHLIFRLYRGSISQL